MTSPIEPMLRAMGPALDSIAALNTSAAPADAWPELWARVGAARRRPVPIWPVFASGALCLVLFLSSTLASVMLGVTPTAAAMAAPAPLVNVQAQTPDETQSVGERSNPAIDATASAGTAAVSTPAPLAPPER